MAQAHITSVGQYKDVICGHLTTAPVSDLPDWLLQGSAGQEHRSPPAPFCDVCTYLTQQQQASTARYQIAASDSILMSAMSSLQPDFNTVEAAQHLHAAAGSAISSLALQHQWQSRQLIQSTQPPADSTSSFASACASLWAPLKRNRDADKLYCQLNETDVNSGHRYSCFCCTFVYATCQS